MSRSRHIIALVCNLATAVLVVYAFCKMFFATGIGALMSSGWNALRFFTVDSNLLAGLACLCLVPVNIAGIAKDGAPLPQGLFVLKFVGTAAVTVTFVTVMCFLGPVSGFARMLSGANFWFHLICPLLCIISFCLVEKGPLSIPQCLIGLIPVVVYGAVYLTLVLIIGPENGGWYDWYGFNRGGMWPVSISAMFVGALAICLLLRLPHRPRRAERQ